MTGNVATKRYERETRHGTPSKHGFLFFKWVGQVYTFSHLKLGIQAQAYTNTRAWDLSKCIRLGRNRTMPQLLQETYTSSEKNDERYMYNTGRTIFMCVLCDFFTHRSVVSGRRIVGLFLRRRHHASKGTDDVKCRAIHFPPWNLKKSSHLTSGWKAVTSLLVVYLLDTTAVPIIIEGRFQAFQRFSGSKLVLKTVESCFMALNHYGNGSKLDIFSFFKRVPLWSREGLFFIQGFVLGYGYGYGYERAYFTYKDLCPNRWPQYYPGWDRKWCPHPVEIIAHSWAERPRYYSVILSQPTLDSERASVLQSMTVQT